MPSRPTITALVTDLDNTLWDWFGIWHASFRAFLDELICKTGFSEAILLPQIKRVHEKHSTAEYAFLLQELPIIHEQYPGVEITEEFRAVIEAHSRARKIATKLYPEVHETIMTLRSQGVLIVGYTESFSFYTARRLRNTELDGLLDYLYSPPDHDLPSGLTRDQIRAMPDAYYELKTTLHRETPRGVTKPAPKILHQILADLDLSYATTAYVGDSLIKDVSMAQQVGIMDVHAQYGQSHLKKEYDLLRQVTHWTAESVERERCTTRGDVMPKYTLRDSFGELLELFRCQPFADKNA